MTASSLLEFIAREHPAFVHIPLGLVAVLPLAMLASFHPKHGKVLAGTVGNRLGIELKQRCLRGDGVQPLAVWRGG